MRQAEDKGDDTARHVLGWPGKLPNRAGPCGLGLSRLSLVARCTWASPRKLSHGVWNVTGTTGQGQKGHVKKHNI